MMRRNSCYGCVSALLVAAGGLWFSDLAFGGEKPAPSEHVGLVISHLPLKTSRAYHALRRTAGDPDGEILPMTKSEMWSVARENLAAFKLLARKSGVSVEEVDDPAMNALVPMAAGHTMTRQQSKMMHSAMQDKSTMGFSMMSLPDPAMLEYALTRGMQKPQQESASITLKLSSSVTVTARRTDLTSNSDNYVWQGEIEGTGEPVTLVFWPQGRISGTVQHGGAIFKVQSLGEGVHGVIETAPAMLPPEHAPMGEPMKRKFDMKDDPLEKRGDATSIWQSMAKTSEKIDNLKDQAPEAKVSALNPSVDIKEGSRLGGAELDQPTTITLIVAYTKAAASHYADISKDLIALAAAETNQSFRMSGIANLQVNVVYSYQTDYVEKGTHFDHMIHFAEKGDGIADEIHALRDKYHADIAMMIVDDANGCGLSAGVAPPAERAFAVVHHGCAAATYSLAHEIGHIVGARHDMGYDDNKAPYPYGHGFVNGTKWRTMMSYEQSCGGCPRLPIWSSPDLMVRGESAGSELSNNARAVREGAKRVAAFR